MISEKKKDFINRLLFNAGKKNLSIAFYSIPGMTTFHGMVAFSEPGNYKKTGHSFWLHPFHTGSDSPFLILRADIFFGDEISWQLPISLDDAEPTWWTAPNNVEISSEQSFVENVRSAQILFSNGEFEKLVICRTLKKTLPHNFSPAKTLETLREKYPNAFVYLVSTPFSGTWIGATPEILIQKKENEMETVALAGTRKATSSSPWTDKEFHEQQLVTKYILDFFQSQNIENYSVKGPSEFSAGHLIHLRTSFQAKLPAIHTEKDLYALLRHFHPTPAVGGFPKQNAAERINSIEKFDRSYYAGFLGPVYPNGDADIFVNLRCMKILRDHALLYAGAGITAGSDPLKELEETAAKAATIGSVF